MYKNRELTGNRSVASYQEQLSATSYQEKQTKTSCQLSVVSWFRRLPDGRRTKAPVQNFREDCGE